MNLVPNKQMSPNVTLQSTKYRTKELCVDRILQKNNRDVS